MDTQKTKSFFTFSSESSAFFLLALFTFLIPLTFSPSQYLNFFFSKTAPLFIVTILALFFFIFKIFREGKYKVSLHPLFLTALFIPVWYLVSSFFSVYPHNSLLGVGIESDTTTIVAILFLFSFFMSYFVRSKDKIFLTYVIFGSSYVILALFHIIRLFGLFFSHKNILVFSLFLDSTSNTIGKWNEMAIVSGVALLLSLISIEFLKLSRNFKIFSYVVLVFSTFLLAITNFPLILENSLQIPFFSLIGVFALIFFVYFLSSSYELSRKASTEEEIDIKLNKKRKIPLASLIILLISVVFTFGYREIGSYVQTHFNVSSYEERPTWGWTSSTIWKSIKQKPFTGYGPNNFVTSWDLNKPGDVNPTSVWNNDFTNGVGYIPSTLVTTGPIGFLGWIAFLVLFIILGIKALFMRYKDKFSQYLTVSSFLISIFLWIVAFFYNPTIVVLTLTFLFSGLFLGSVIREGIIKEKDFIFENSKEKTFASIMVLVVLLVASIFWTYAFGQRLASAVYATEGAVQFGSAVNDADLLKAQSYYTQALQVSPSDVYLRAITNINLSRASLLLNNSNNNTASGEQLRINFIAAYQNAYGAANDAVTLNKNDYQNYLSRGAVSESIVSLGVQSVAGLGVDDAYQDAKNNYLAAEKLNPKSPLIPLLLARLDISKKDPTSAKQHVAESLALKSNYPDAYLLKAQIQLAENDAKGALTTLTEGSLNSTPDSNLFFSLGALQYNNKNYSDSATSFEKAIILNPYYANARYFLALSYYNLGRKDEAITQLQQVKFLNPNNKDIDTLLTTFQSGAVLPTATQQPTVTTSASSTTATSTSIKSTTKK